MLMLILRLVLSVWWLVLLSPMRHVFLRRIMKRQVLIQLRGVGLGDVYPAIHIGEEV